MMVMDEVDGVVDGGNRVVAVMGIVIDGVDGLGSVVDGGLDGFEETALAVCWWYLKKDRRRC